MLIESVFGVHRLGVSFLAAAFCAGLGWWCAGFASRYSSMLLEADLHAVDVSEERDEVWHASWFAYCSAVLMVLLSFILQRRYGLGLFFFGSIAGLAMLVILTIVDIKTYLLPDAFTLPLLWLGLILAWAGTHVTLHDAVAGVVVGYGFLFVLFLAFKYIRKQDGMGYGDFKLAAALGAWVGVQQLPYMLLAASVFGVVFAFCRSKPLGLRSVYPFGPFLAVSGVTIIVLVPKVQSYF